MSECQMSLFQAFKWKADWYNYLFPWLLYPFSEIALCSSIYMTVAIAVERYIGLCRPFQGLKNSMQFNSLSIVSSQ